MLNKNFHHIVLLPLSAFVVSFLASLFIIPGPRANNNLNRNDEPINVSTHYNPIPPDNNNSDVAPPCATFCSKHCDGDCRVCFCDIADEHYVLPCGHKFCKECIDNWAKECKKEITEDVKVEVAFPKGDIDAACASRDVRIEDAVEGARYIEKREEYSSNNEVYVYEVTEKKIIKPSQRPYCPLCRAEFALPNKSLFSTIFGFNIF